MEENKLVVISEDGTETEMEILFTFKDDQFSKEYVLYVDPLDETGEVFVSAYDENGSLNDITDEKEWEMVEEVFSAFLITHEDESTDEEHEHTH